jgi:hypothetical protein
MNLNGQKQLLLPLDYRASRFAVYDSTLAIGCPSGAVLILEFSHYKEEKMKLNSCLPTKVQAVWSACALLSFLPRKYARRVLAEAKRE